MASSILNKPKHTLALLNTKKETETLIRNVSGYKDIEDEKGEQITFYNFANLINRTPFKKNPFACNSISALEGAQPLDFTPKYNAEIPSNFDLEMIKNYYERQMSDYELQLLLSR